MSGLADRQGARLAGRGSAQVFFLLGAAEAEMDRGRPGPAQRLVEQALRAIGEADGITPGEIARVLDHAERLSRRVRGIDGLGAGPRKKKKKTPVWAYHGTARSAIPYIKRYGLVPMPREGTKFGAVFFTDSETYASQYAGSNDPLNSVVLGVDYGVTLRFRWPKDAVHWTTTKDENYEEWISATPVPPAALQVFDEDQERWVRFDTWVSQEAVSPATVKAELEQVRQYEQIRKEADDIGDRYGDESPEFTAAFNARMRLLRRLYRTLRTKQGRAAMEEEFDLYDPGAKR